jgi:hypothetical protein
MHADNTTTGNGNTFGVDLLTQGTVPAFGLGLNIDKFQFFYSGNDVAIATSGTSTGLVTQDQDLPFGLEFDPTQPLAIVFSSANLSNVTTLDGFVTGFNAAGTGDISGTLLPEPATLSLLVLGGLLAARRRRG